MEYLVLVHSAILGGAARSLSTVIELLQESGCQVTILTPPGAMVPVWEKIGARIVFWDPPACQWLGKPIFSSTFPAHGLNALAFHLITLLKLPGRLKRASEVLRQTVQHGSYTQIYVNSLALFPLARVLASLRSRHIRVVWQIRERLNEALLPLVYSQIVQRVARASDTLIAITANEAAPFAAHVPVEIIHNSVPRRWSEAARDSQTLDRAVPRVGMASDFHTGKGVADFIAMAEQLQPKYPAAEFLLYTPHPQIHQGPTARILRLVGGWNDKVPLVMDALAKANGVTLRENIRVHFDRALDLDTLRQMTVYVRADRAACPWGRDIIEAMWAGVPVVATGTSQEFVLEGETGFLVPPGRPDLLADRVERLLSDPALREEMSEASGARARKLFAPEVFSEKLKRVLLNNRAAAYESVPVKAELHVN